MVWLGDVKTTGFVAESEADAVVSALPSDGVGELAIAALPQVLTASWTTNSCRLRCKDEPTLWATPQNRHLLLRRSCRLLH